MTSSRFLLVGGLATALVFNATAVSYVRTVWHNLLNQAESSVPVGFQIERLHGMLIDLEPEVNHAVRVIAEQQILDAELDQKIANNQAAQHLEAQHLDELQRALGAEGKAVCVIQARQYERATVEQDLTRRFERFKGHAVLIAQLQEQRAARAKCLAAAEKKLTAMRQAQNDAQVELANLEAKKAELEAEAVVSAVVIDDSKFGRFKELVEDLNHRLDVDLKTVQLESASQNESVSFEPTGNDNIASTVRKYLDQHVEQVAARH